MSHFYALIVFLLALSFLLPMISRLLRRSPRDKARVIVEYAQKRRHALVNPSLAQALDVSPVELFKNPAFRNSIKASSDIADIDGLDNGTGDRLAFTCNLRSKEVTIFNLNVTIQTVQTNSPGISYKVAKIRAAELPRFSVGRNSALHALENVVGKITGASKPTIDVDAHQYPEFSAHFWIRGSDHAAVAAFLSADKITFLETAELQGHSGDERKLSRVF